MHRVELLADREDGAKPPGAPPFKSIIPLPEIISETIQVGVNSKAVDAVYQKLLAELGSEFSILLDKPLPDIEASSTARLSEAVGLVRAGKVHIAPGYDGEYGKIKIFEEIERRQVKGQTLMF